jgi:hypothetical protein
MSFNSIGESIRRHLNFRKLFLIGARRVLQI